MRKRYDYHQEFIVRHLSMSALNVERVKCGDEKEVYLSINQGSVSLLLD